MPARGLRPVVGLAATVAFHDVIAVLAASQLARSPKLSDQSDLSQRSPRDQAIVLLDLRSSEQEEAARVDPLPPVPAPAPRPEHAWVPVPLPEDRLQEPAPPRAAATMQAPPAPTAAEWAFASTYKLKNSKGYRYTWGQQVRSMMGTAVEGPDQGLVRFRVEIAPDGHLARLETLWSTSDVAERLARQAVSSMPRWPPSPTGRPLIFERTISFSPFASDGPPLYRNDCQPDPPAFRNPFVWDGRSPRVPVQEDPDDAADALDPLAAEECQRQLPKDTIEAESAHDQRLMDQWGTSRRGR